MIHLERNHSLGCTTRARGFRGRKGCLHKPGFAGICKETNTFQGSATNTKEENRRVSAPYPQDTRCREEHSALFAQKFSFLRAPLSYPLSAQKQQGTGDYFNEQHEQETQRCGARFKAQMAQALSYFTEGHSLGLYTSFIKLCLNWCSHLVSRNHHACFPFKRGNKYFIGKAFCIRGSESPSLALCLAKPRRQTAAYPADGLRRRKELQGFAQNGSGSRAASSPSHLLPRDAPD